MQVTETQSEGLKRDFNIVVPASELDSRLVERLEFAPGRGPPQGIPAGQGARHPFAPHVRQSTMAEIVQNMLGEVASKTLTERGERAATPPDYELPEDPNDDRAGARRARPTSPTR